MVNYKVIEKNPDVVVAGGGPSGIIAALAAAKAGQNTILVEKEGFLGGNMMLPLPVYGFLNDEGEQIIEGIPGELFERFKKLDLASRPYTDPLHKGYIIVDSEGCKRELIDVLLENDIEMFFYTDIIGTLRQGNKITGVIIQSKSGVEILQGKIFIDATGDADLIANSGFDYYTRDNIQPPSLIFNLRGVDINKFRKFLINNPEYTNKHFGPDYFKEHHFIVLGSGKLVKKANKKGCRLPINKLISFTPYRVNDEMIINMTRDITFNTISREAKTKASINMTKQIPKITSFFKSYVPGFENSYLSNSSSFIGVRETRTINGLYTINSEDVLSGREFYDSIGYASYFVDIHRNNDKGFSYKFTEAPCQIPLRSLVPKNAENIIVAGRSISSTKEALSLLRVMGTCMVMGQGAGALASISVDENKAVQKIPYEKVRELLISQGALV